MDVFESNIQFLENMGLDELSNTLKNERSKIDFKKNGELEIEGKIIYSDIENEMYSQLKSEFEYEQKVRLARFTTTNQQKSTQNISIETIDTRENSLFINMQCNNNAIQARIKSNAKDYAIMGSMALPYILKGLQNSQYKLNNPVSITILESSYTKLAASLCLYNYKTFVDDCKTNNIGLHLIVGEDFDSLREQSFQYFHEIIPTAIYGLVIIREKFLTSELAKLNSWMFSNTGFTSRFTSGFGFTSDELNQTMHMFYNKHLNQERKVITESREIKKRICVVTGSGPSIDETITKISKYQEQLVIIATHSTIGILLYNNIVPDYLVIVERNSIVTDIIKEVIHKYPQVKDIPLIASHTISPEIPVLFRNKYFFHRPKSTAASLSEESKICALPTAGPESINCALEVAYMIGYREVILLGADFGAKSQTYPRSKSALGISPRSLELPVKGNKGRTIYSQPSLVLVRDAINWYNGVFTDLKIYRFGEGIELDCAIEIDENKLRDIMKNITTKKSNSSIRKLESKVIMEKNDEYGIEAFKSSIVNNVENYKQILSKGDWDINTSREIGKLLNEDGDIGCKLAAKRLIRQVIFLSLSILYDSDKTNLKIEAKEKYFESLDKIVEIISMILDAQTKQMNTVNDGNISDWRKEIKEIILAK